MNSTPSNSVPNIRMYVAFNIYLLRCHTMKSENFAIVGFGALAMA